MEFTQEQKLYAEIVHKAWENAEFKSELMANPVETIEKFTGNKITLPEGRTLVVKDQTDASKVYLNIPGKVDLESVELTDEQLEIVAGGEVLASVGIGLAVAGMIAAGYCYGKSQQ